MIKLKIANPGKIIFLPLKNHLKKIILTVSSIIIFSSLFNSCTCSLPLTYGLKISQFGITWYFDKEYKHGRFANGDYWVVGPVAIVYIDPPSKYSGSRVKNGSMVNIDQTTGREGYDNGNDSLSYSDSLNAALDVSQYHPLKLAAGSSLVSTISIAEENNRPQLSDAAILTVLDSAPPDGSFRPPYCGSDKTIKYNISLLSANSSLLKQKAVVDDTPDIATVERYFERPWIDHISNWTAGLIHPENNMPNYGREISSEVGIGALMLHLNYDYSFKETLLIRYIQLGIDLYGVLENGGEWPNDGGHASGRKWPILFAGIMLGDAGMKAVGEKSGDYLYDGDYEAGDPPPDYIHFGEDDQTFIVSSEDTGRTLTANWEGIVGEAYTGMEGMPEWGIGHSTNPGIDNSDWNASYRRCCTALAWPGFVLAALIMDADTGSKALWNHDALFDYMDRYMAIENGEDDGWTVVNEATGWRSSSSFAANMWDAYR